MFDEAQMRCLRATLDTIIPPDDYPGAWDAGVGEYLHRQLRGDLADLLPAYRTWLDCLDAEAQARHSNDFASLSQAERNALLDAVQEGNLSTTWSLEAGSFFSQVVEHCAEGYYSDPGNGGNRDGVAWRMIGYEVSA